MQHVTLRNTNMRANPGRRWRRPLLVIACIGLAAAGCSSSGSSGSSASATPKAPKGTVSVAYASSLEYLNEKVVGPAFEKAEGYKYSGTGAASGTLSSEI